MNGTSSLRAYKMNIAMYGREGENVDDVLLPANHCVLEKIGYDAEKRPLFTMKITDGCRKVSQLGYVVPVGTEPAYPNGSAEVETPMCDACQACMNEGIMTLDENGEQTGDENGMQSQGHGCGADMCWCH